MMAARSSSPVAMEPSFWSWEKDPLADVEYTGDLSQWSPAFGAGKSRCAITTTSSVIQSQWSPAFGAGKSHYHLFKPLLTL